MRYFVYTYAPDYHSDPIEMRFSDENNTLMAVEFALANGLSIMVRSNPLTNIHLLGEKGYNEIYVSVMLWKAVKEYHQKKILLVPQEVATLFRDC